MSEKQQSEGNLLRKGYLLGGNESRQAEGYLFQKGNLLEVPESDWLPISALQHLMFCPRQCALIHIEREWRENILTAKGRVEHERVHEGYREFRRGKKQISGLRISSQKLGLQGQLDVLELELVDERGADNLSALGFKGMWKAYPVEFKHGEPKEDDCDRIQVCAQALCLEEMLDIHIMEAALFYQKTKRREVVVIDEALRCKTAETAKALHTLIRLGKTPAPRLGKFCNACSLKFICMPKTVMKKTERYRKRLFDPQEAE